MIVKAFTESDGLKTYLLKGVLGSRKGKLKVAYFQPLMQLEMVATHRNKGSMERLQEVKSTYPYQTLQTNVTKNAVAFFLSEMLVNSIQEEERNQGLFRYMEAAFQWLDTHDQIANFHLYFLLELTKYFGFYPETATGRSAYFDLQDGQYIPQPGVNPMLTGDRIRPFCGTS